jgi:hypothetical protein
LFAGACRACQASDMMLARRGRPSPVRPLNSIVRPQGNFGAAPISANPHMHLVKQLLDNAHADTDLLKKNDANGDDFSVPRDVDFLLRAPDEIKAKLVRDFVNDNQYGVAAVQSDESGFGVLIVVHMAPQQHVLCSVSALMVCLGQLFGLEYDGWGCELKPRAEA